MKQRENPKSLELTDWELEAMQHHKGEFYLRRPANWIEGKINIGDQIHLVHNQMITPPRVVDIKYETFEEMRGFRGADAAKQEGWDTHPLSYANLWNQMFGEEIPYNENVKTAQLKLTWII